MLTLDHMNELGVEVRMTFADVLGICHTPFDGGRSEAIARAREIPPIPEATVVWFPSGEALNDKVQAVRDLIAAAEPEHGDQPC